MSKYKFIPDWVEPRKLVMVYPVDIDAYHNRTSRDTVLPLFNELLRLLNIYNKGLDILIVLQPSFSNSFVMERLKETYTELKFSFKFFQTNDIWIRDWAPVVVSNNSEIKMVKAKYDPPYCYRLPAEDHLAGLSLQIELSNDLNFIPLRWDFGNLSTNGKDIIVTQQLTKENGLSENQLDELLRHYFDFDQLMVIPIEKYDTVGHADSICRFISEDTIVLPSYPDYFTEEQDYVKGLYEHLISKFVRKYKYIFIDSNLSEVINKEDIYSAEGCYINYLRLGNNLYLPQFNLPQDKEAIRILKKRTKLNIIPVPNCSSLAFLGGVLNCITWVNY